MSPWVTAIVALLSAGAGAVGAYVALRKEGRDTRLERTSEADRTIDLLKEQNTLLGEMLKQRDKERAEERKLWAQREAKLEDRIEKLEAWRIKEIESRRQLGMCAKAPDCENYDAGSIDPT